MNAIMPREQLYELVKPCYYEGVCDNKPYDLELMLKILLIQNLHDLYNEGTRNEIIDSCAFSDYREVESSNQMPDNDTIGRLRNLLTQNHIHEQFFALVVKTLIERGLILKKGTIVASTIISAPSFTKHKENAWYFGYKAHVGIDKDSGLVHTMEVSPSNEHDVTMML